MRTATILIMVVAISTEHMKKQVGSMNRFARVPACDLNSGARPPDTAITAVREMGGGDIVGIE
jgi:hypothetical protein